MTIPPPALAATPNKLADGYIKNEEKVLENFEEDVVTSVSGFDVSYTEKRKTDGARAHALSLEGCPG